jgi:hydroxyethylthiazole kinase-like uncharacterized protein yjeF
MFGLYPAEDVRRAEDRLLARVPSGSLMHIASRGLATHIIRLLADVRGGLVGARMVLLVGSGNNGGDALFAGAYLIGRGADVMAVATGEGRHQEGERAFLRAGGKWIDRLEALEAMAKADVIVDGIVGIGAHGGLREPARTLVERANTVDALRVAVDLPSGIDVDSGRVHGEAFHADMTITFGCFKPGLFLHPARDDCGAVHLVDIGLSEELPDPSMRAVEVFDVAELLRDPDSSAHKYRRGVVGIAAGGSAYPGAAVLAAGAARYSGVGMVRFLDRGDGVARSVVTAFPDVVADPGDPRADSRVRAWGCGPGFTPGDTETVAMVLEQPTPIVLDAGALQCLSNSEHLQNRVRSRADRGLTTILTPHAGEYAALFGPDRDPSSAALDWGVIVVRKGPSTTITAPDGSVFVDQMGTSDLACAGSGDVLTGLLAGMVAANPDDDPAEVAAAAVWLHGLSGRLASGGERPITALDIGSAIPEAIAVARVGDLTKLRA